VGLIVVATVGAVLGDHVPYLAGRLAGTRILALYCRITLASDLSGAWRQRWGTFARFGAAALLFSRFSTSVRLFASACAGCAELTYLRYLIFDAVGTVLYTTLWVLVGTLIGERGGGVLHDRPPALAVSGPGRARGLRLLGYRLLWRRYRYGVARPSSIDAVRTAC